MNIFKKFTNIFAYLRKMGPVRDFLFKTAFQFYLEKHFDLYF